MAKLIDDSTTLYRMAEAIVVGHAEHPTGALRWLGISPRSSEARRLLRKWASIPSPKRAA